LTAAAKRTGRTFVWTSQADPSVVVAYFTLAAHLLRRDSLPRRLGRGDPAEVPAVLLARLALDRRLQGQGLGSVLLVIALRKLAAASEDVAARYVVVDAIDDRAAAFCKAHGFTRLPDGGRLVRTMSAVAGDLLRYG
jgi:GNAT superfamily N-acetyltransferase